MDYTSTPITATFIAGADSTTIDVPVTSDNATEESETFDLTFTIPSSLSRVIPGNIIMAVGNITDSTCKFLLLFLSSTALSSLF